jgi:hypothetical protein
MTYIYDIVTSIELIEEYIKDVSFNQFEKDIGIQDKVCDAWRLLEKQQGDYQKILLKNIKKFHGGK